MFARTLVTNVGRRAFSKLNVPARRSNLKVIGFVAVTGATFAATSMTSEAASVDINAVRKDIASAITAYDQKKDDGTSINGTLIR